MMKDEPNVEGEEIPQNVNLNSDVNVCGSDNFRSCTGNVKKDVKDENNDNKEDDEYSEEEEASRHESEESIEETHLEPYLLYREPAYAEICSFFNVFSSMLNIKPIPFTKLEKIFCTLYNGEVDSELIDLHIMLMRKIYLKFARADKFESALDKFCSLCPALESESLQLQRYSYSNLPLSIRLIILKALCESQFDCNVKFKENIFNTFPTNELRLTAIGYDKNGFAYFYQQDCELNIRVYTEEPDDLSGGTWTLKARSERGLLNLISELKSPDFGKKNDTRDEDEDIDEDQLLDKNLKLNVTEAVQNLSTKSQTDIPAVELTESEMNSIATTNKRFTILDIYRDSTIINKKKIEKEGHKKERGNKNINISNSNVEAMTVEEDEPEKDTEEIDEESLLAIVTDDRRVLPRRSARNNAMTNIKAFTSSGKKNTPKKSPATIEKSKLKELEHSEDEESSNVSLEDEDDEDEEELNSSDDDFILQGPKQGNNLTNTNIKKKRKPARRQLGKPPLSVKSKQKQPMISFVDESSDDEEPVEEQKERKKATEKTLCMECQSSKRPDLLLLCDMCDDAWHTWCLKPQLWYVPDGDWFCPNCQHVMLVQKLSYALLKLREALKVKEMENKKKQAAADRLKREMDYIGISLNNIIPSNISVKNSEESSSSSSNDDGQRRSKRRAMKKVLSRSARKHSEKKYYGPVVTIAEGRSRRTLTKVDYNFHAYDEQLQEAMETIDSNSKIKDETACGLGRGKDMANIIEAERKRKFSQENGSDKEELIERLAGHQPPTKKSKKRKSQKKLTDLDLDNITESSDTEEYHESNEEIQSEDPEPSEDEYLPREFRKTRSCKRGGRTKSDDDFIDDEELSDYEMSLKRKSKKLTKGNNKKNRRGRRKDYSNSDDGSDTSEEYCSESSDNSGIRRRRPIAKSKWGPKASTSESDEEELETISKSSGDEKTETGRPLRKAAVEMKKKIQSIEKELDGDVEDEEEFEEGENDDNNSNVNKDSRPMCTLPRFRKAIISDGEDDEEPDFQPDVEDEESTDEDEEEVEKKDDVNKKDENENRRDTFIQQKGLVSEKKTVTLNNEQRISPKFNNDMKLPLKDTTKVSDAASDKADTADNFTEMLERGTELSKITPSCSVTESEIEISKNILRRQSRGPSIRKQLSNSSSVQLTLSPTATIIAPQSMPSQAGLVPQLLSSTAPPSVTYTPPSTHQVTIIQPISHPAPSLPHLSHLQTYTQAPQTQYYALSTQQPNKIITPQHVYISPTNPIAGSEFSPQPFPHQYAPAPPPQSQYLYQSLQPFDTHQQQVIVDPRTGQFIESDSLGHALAGAMNPEDL